MMLMLIRVHKFKILLLSLIWLILSENFSVINIVAGLVISILAVYFTQRLLLLPHIPRMRRIKFLLYPFYLIASIYVSSFEVIKIIIKGGQAEVVKVETKLKTEFFRTILGNSITLTPGTILLDQKDKELTVLWLRRSGAEDEYKDNLEDKLLEIEKRK